MEKRAILAAVLSVAVLLIWNLFVAPPPKKPMTPVTTETPDAGSPETSQEPVAAPVKPEPTASTGTAPAEKETAAIAEVPTSTEVSREIVVENNLYRAVFSTRGASLVTWDLKAYRTVEGEEVRLVEPASYSLPPTTILLNDQRAELPAEVVYSASRDAVSFGDGDTQQLTFTYRGEDGLRIEKSLTFYSNRYSVDLATKVQGAPGYQVVLGNGFGIPANEPPSRYAHSGPALLTGTKRKNFALKDTKDGDVSFAGEVRWIAQEQKYFAASLKPAEGTGSARLFRRNDKLEISLRSDSETARYLLYAGPKQYDILKKSGLQDIVDFGFWSFIAHPLFWLLKKLYGATGNYGVAIVLISVLTRVPFIPLMTKQQSSMKKMQQMAPKIQEIKKKFKNDPQRINQETMKLYKEGGVNPVSGCMPMLLQIPVFFALYKVLLAAIELRQAPFVGWLTDLSAPDTLFGHFPDSIPLLGGSALGILPVVMGVTMFVQQRMTPNPSADPNQQKIMKYLPVIFTFMFFNLSSGLVLYWTVGNVIGIAQQVVVNRRAAARAAAAAAS